MRKIRLLIELEYDDVVMHGDDVDSKRWFDEDVLGSPHLYLGEQGDLGDHVGYVRVIERLR